MQISDIKYLMIVLMICLLSSCAIKPPVTTDYDTNYDFTQLKTYAWIALDPDKVSTLDNKRQKNAIGTILNRKGFRLINQPKKADFLLKTHSVTDKKINVDRFYQTWGYHPFYHPHWPYNSSTIVREYKVGTLVLDIVDPTNKQVVWRGSVSKPLGIYKNRTPAERTTIAMSNAEHMLASFPPEKLIPD